MNKSGRQYDEGPPASIASGFEDQDGQENNTVNQVLAEDVNGSDQEFYSVSQILAERQFNGAIKYLVEWEDYSLHEATWEPPEHLEQDTISEWEEFKTTSGRRTARGFRVEDWKTAVQQHNQGERARQEELNRERLFNGLPPEYLDKFLEDLFNTADLALEDFEEPDDQGVLFVDQKQAEPDPMAPTDEQGTLYALSGEHGLHHQEGATVVGSKLHERTDSIPVARRSTKRKVDEENVESPAQKTLSASEEIRKRPNPSKASRPRSTIDIQASSSTSKYTGVFKQNPRTPGSAKAVAEATSKKTMHDPKAGYNVFIGGKSRKNNPTLLDAMSNSDKRPKMLKPRLQNLLQKQLRDREGVVAPTLTPNQLISLCSRTPYSAGLRSTIDNDQIVGDGSTGFSRGSPPSSSKMHLTMYHQLNPQPSSGEQVQSGLEWGASLKFQNAATGKKRKRSVRWDDTLTTVVEAPNFDHFPESSDAAEHDDARAVSDHRTPVATELGGNAQMPETQTVTRKCRFGTEGTQPIALDFSGLPRDADAPWLQQFRSHASLIFTHTCTSHDMSLGADLQQRQLCRGYVSSSAVDREKAESIANWLKIGHLCLMCHNSDHCVLISASDRYEPQRDNRDLVCYTLSYIVIEPSTFFGSSMLASLPHTASMGLQAGHLPQTAAVDFFFELDYSQLLPPNAKSSERHSFFLAFPPSAWQEAHFMFQWLRYLDAGCNINTSLHSGGWSSFAKSDHGTLILHETAIWAIRMFPDFSDLLQGPASIFFSHFLFGRVGSSTPASPSLNAAPPGFGRLELRPIFGQGTAHLVTPSFLVSQPEQAYVFFKWLFQSKLLEREGNRRGKLVVCTGFEDWLLSLTLEKSRQSNSMATVRERRRAALTQHATDSRLKTLKLFRSLVAQMADDTESPVVSAPESIDGNDEQSLVNWFAWWTVMNADHFRRFYVVGSSNQHPTRMSRLIQVPDYEFSFTRDPQTARRPQLDHVGPEKSASEWKLVPSDDAATLTDFIMQVETQARTQAFRPLGLFRFPISYWNRDMPFHFKDIHSAFASFQKWFQFYAGFLATTRVKFNSYAGFFYTVDRAWDPANYPRDAKPVRRPWIAIFRPMNPHLRPWRETELFIWDCITWARYPGNSEVYSNELICAQQELVELVRSESRSIRFPLQQVWLGGSVADQDGQQLTKPLDITLHWLKNLPPNIKDLIPAPEDMLPGRGWKVVKQEPAPRGIPHRKSADVMDIDPVTTTQSAKGEPSGTKVVFHPPDATGQTTNWKYRNRLFEWAEAERRRGVTGKSEFSFEPTKKWYADQLRNGQGYRHILVESWEQIFAGHKISDPKYVANSSATEGKDDR